MAFTSAFTGCALIKVQAGEALVNANRELVARMEEKIQGHIYLRLGRGSEAGELRSALSRTISIFF